MAKKARTARRREYTKEDVKLLKAQRPEPRWQEFRN